MRHWNRWLAVAVLGMAVPLAACTPVSTDYERTHEPAEAVPIEGTDLHRIILEEDAIDRLAVETAPVRDAGGDRTVIPYAALLYDAHGGSWAYTSIGPHTFVRDRLRVAHVKGDRVVLFDGPETGTEVVIVGGQELFGIETGVGH